MPRGGLAPSDFASFVDTHEQRLRTACHDLTGQGQLGDLLAIDLLATIALRWRLWRRGRRAGAGEARLDRLLRLEQRAWRHPAETATKAGRIRVLVDGPASPGGFADEAWWRARGKRRRRAMVCAGVVALLGCIALIGPRPPDLAVGPDVEPTAAPAGVLVMPTFAELAKLTRRGTQLPFVIDASSASTVDITDGPVHRALAVLQRPAGPIVVLAEDGSSRVAGDPALAGAKLLPTSLSPDGARVALLADDGLRILDLNAGTVRTLPTQTGGLLVWVNARTVLVQAGADSVEVNVDTGRSAALRGPRAADVVTARGPADPRLIELIGSAASDVLPPRIRQWESGSSFEDVPVFAPPWIGDWVGSGWSSLDLLARICLPTDISLPGKQARSAVGAVHANGLYEATLVAVDSTVLDVIGFVDTGTVMVVAYSPGSSQILAWSPQGSSIQLVATVNGYLRLSVADLVASGT